MKATPPTLMAPISDVQVASLTPQLTVANGAGVYDSSVKLTYQFQILEGTTLVAESDLTAAGGSETSWTVPANLLKLNQTYLWHARAAYNAVAGPWSPIASFKTPLPVVASGPGPGPGPVPCAGGSGDEIVACVAAAYPDRLAITSLSERIANMDFLRDRIIETGKCRGLNLGLNLKRGGPEISHDFIVLRSDKGKNGTDRGVDLASGYDDNKVKLKLGWSVHNNPDTEWGHPFYKDYGQVDCSGVS